MLCCFRLLQKMTRDCLSSVIIYALLMCDSCLQAIKELLAKIEYCLELVWLSEQIKQFARILIVLAEMKSELQRSNNHHLAVWSRYNFFHACPAFVKNWFSFESGSKSEAANIHDTSVCGIPWYWTSLQQELGKSFSWVTPISVARKRSIYLWTVSRVRD